LVTVTASVFVVTPALKVAPIPGAAVCAAMIDPALGLRAGAVAESDQLA
jgi:hypothetical protein